MVVFFFTSPFFSPHILGSTGAFFVAENTWPKFSKSRVAKALTPTHERGVILGNF
jgi:hypothetical protein